MQKLTGLVVALLVSAPLASADPTAGRDTKVHTRIPPMLCALGSDDADPAVGPNVVCQGSFVAAPASDDQAVITASGAFGYRSANIGIGNDQAPLDTLFPGRTYHIQGWTVVAGADGVRFSNDATGRGMLIGGDTTVDPF